MHLKPSCEQHVLDFSLLCFNAIFSNHLTLCHPLLLLFNPSLILSYFSLRVSHIFKNGLSTLHAATTAAKLLQPCLILCDPIDGSPPGLPIPRDSPGKNTGVGCHFLLQYMKVKSESEVSQSCLTLCDPMDCNLPGSSVHGIFQARVPEWGAIAFSVSIIQLLSQLLDKPYCNIGLP